MTSKLKTHLKHFAIGSLVAALGAGTYAIAAVVFTDFLTATPISSTEMNNKLNALKTAVNAMALTCVNVESASTPVAAGATFSVDAPACAAGFTQTGPFFRNTTTFSNLLVVNNFFASTPLTCQGMNGTAGAVNVFCGARCCKVQ